MDNPEQSEGQNTGMSITLYSVHFFVCAAVTFWQNTLKCNICHDFSPHTPTFMTTGRDSWSNLECRDPTDEVLVEGRLTSTVEIS